MLAPTRGILRTQRTWPHIAKHANVKTRNKTYLHGCIFLPTLRFKPRKLHSTDWLPIGVVKNTYLTLKPPNFLQWAITSHRSIPALIRRSDAPELVASLWHPVQKPA